ncbi:MAG: hypothetical protein ACRDQ4_06910 [Pseudonocardiaceae bacterium]
MLATSPVQQDRSLQVALRRFVFADSQSLPEDRLIDLNICCEALLSKRGKIKRRQRARRPDGFWPMIQYSGGKREDVEPESTRDCRPTSSHQGRLPHLPHAWYPRRPDRARSVPGTRHE